MGVANTHTHRWPYFHNDRSLFSDRTEWPTHCVGWHRTGSRIPSQDRWHKRRTICPLPCKTKSLTSAHNSMISMKNHVIWIKIVEKWIPWICQQLPQCQNSFRYCAQTCDCSLLRYICRLANFGAIFIKCSQEFCFSAIYVLLLALKYWKYRHTSQRILQLPWFANLCTALLSMPLAATWWCVLSISAKCSNRSSSSISLKVGCPTFVRGCLEKGSYWRCNHSRNLNRLKIAQFQRGVPTQQPCQQAHALDLCVCVCFKLAQSNCTINYNTRMLDLQYITKYAKKMTRKSDLSPEFRLTLMTFNTFCSLFHQTRKKLPTCGNDCSRRNDIFYSTVDLLWSCLMSVLRMARRSTSAITATFVKALSFAMYGSF